MGKILRPVLTLFDPRSLPFSIVVAILTWMLTKLLLQFSAPEAALLSILVLTLRELVRNRLDLDSLRKDLLLERQFQESRASMTGDISRLAKRMSEIDIGRQGPKDLYVSHLSAELRRLTDRVERAALHGELEIATDYIVNVDGVFDAFNVCDEKMLRLTYTVEVGESVLGSEPDIRFLEVALSKLRSKEIRGIRILFIMADQTHGSDEFIRLSSFLSSAGANMRTTEKPTFVRVCSQNHLDAGAGEFGIYGPEMLYLVRSGPASLTGTYFKNRAMVQQYRELFDQCWSSDGLSSPVRCPTRIKSKDTIDLLKTERFKVLTHGLTELPKPSS